MTKYFTVNILLWSSSTAVIWSALAVTFEMSSPSRLHLRIQRNSGLEIIKSKIKRFLPTTSTSAGFEISVLAISQKISMTKLVTKRETSFSSNSLSRCWGAHKKSCIKPLVSPEGAV